ncbi:acetylxylan esterase [Fulvivirgaceae bacterium BMA12]|uniref:Acetylxylan esterase n=1 Tax=Agaribacillus aureus TaxID=3051825 RepID=A0ABT8L6Z7_9BACT|nr:acetylxylan esterase [Fulvivirgaceae bacterium BMA12]
MNAIKVSFLFWLLLLVAFSLRAQEQHNYDESKVPDFTLPPLLQNSSGSPVKTTRQWERIRRPEILSLYKKYVYGHSPESTGQMVFQTINVSSKALENKAIQKEVKVLFIGDKDTVDMNILIYLPKSVAKPVPVFLGMNFYGNHTIHRDAEITLHEKWVNNSQRLGISNHKVGETSRGIRANRWPVERILERGYGLATIYYGDLFPDHAEGADDGVQRLYGKQHIADSTGWGAIATWAWGLSRAMDYFESDDNIDPARVIVMGHSRLGKTALWAGAQDQRFAAVISNNSGCGGAALFRRKFGETVAIINSNFPHWFCKNFHRFNGMEEKLPIDQHMLISLVAPRPVYVASAVEDRWADPKGEFLSAFYASEVYGLYKQEGIKNAVMPPLNKPIAASRIGYHIRSGRHDVKVFDWESYMDFADLHVR